MKKLRASFAGVEVNGETEYSIIDGTGIFKNEAIVRLSENVLTYPKPNL
ncbi:MAG: hypothetical protein PF517_00985 [Salinivirgaceae bacterium]|jgi:hypothetical protein|nr:hypothetical protein [Salinivirgaceae bacterium]